MRCGSVKSYGIHLRSLLGVALLYGALWPLMEVGYLAHRFPAPFLSGLAFYRRYSRFAGGPVEYLANFFSQSYSRHWAGVLAFTLLAVGAWLIARGILRRFSPGSCQWLAAGFPLLILILAGRHIGVLFILPMVAGLAAAWLYMALSIRPRRLWAQRAVVILFLLASIPVYYLLASGFLYLCVMCALFELLARRRPAWGLAWLAFAAAVPYGMSYVYYEPDIAGRYLRWMRMPQYGRLANGLLVAMYLYVPVLAAAAFVAARLRLGGRLKAPLRRATQAAGIAALALLTARLAAFPFERPGWVYADYLIHQGRMEKALAVLAQLQDDSETTRFLSLYALARRGRLLEEMFHYPQQASSEALLLRDPIYDTLPAAAHWRSIVNLELGRVNDSQRWTHEALTAEGETPRVLEGMALIYILNGNPDAARTFLHALEKVPFQAARARRYLEALDQDPSMQADPFVARIRPLMLQRDYIGTWTTEQVLEQCLAANPSNRMAFEYLLAHYLLTFDMEGLARITPRLKDFYRDLPVHVQEALVGYRNVVGSLPPGIDGSAIQRHIESRFQNFVFLWTRVEKGPPEDAWEILAPRYGDTYWFFYIFGRTAAGPPFQARAARPQHKENPR
ncbi:MAG: DUF6057 family protein [Bryobacteraceae bacterium]|nr:DUF6057 family protein [Bryobacteraceae bacterium]